MVEAALELAVEGGFEAVRQREVAERAGVALGTLYKRFRSKDELLIRVLAVETARLAEQLACSMPRNESPLERVTYYFELATYYFVRKPQLGRAVLKAVTAGDNVSEHVLAHHAQQLQHVTAVLRTPEGVPPSEQDLSEADLITVATILLEVWFATLVAWSGGLVDATSVVEHVKAAGQVVLRGVR
jgi:AcrR family transcriptional regulator